MYSLNGVVQYGPGIRVVAWVDQQTSDYYRRLIPKNKYVQPQAYPAHATIVRTGKEEPQDLSAWEKHSGRVIQILYSNEVQFDGTYYYLNVESEEIAEIRMELGLPRYRFDDNKKYHITIGNVKHENHNRTNGPQVNAKGLGPAFGQGI